VPVAPGRILVAMITQSGMAKHFMIHTKMEIPRDHLRAIARIINQNFYGSTLEEVKLHLLEKLRTVQEEYRDLMSLAMEIGEEIKRFSTSEIYLDGASKILALPDFSGAEEMQKLFEVMEEKQILANLLEDEIKQSEAQVKNSKKMPKKDASRVHVRIGSENPVKALQNLSVVSSTYQLADHTVGVLGILGPKRMEYGKMMALVDYVSQIVNQMLKEFGERR
jgi:heat-inducible transcriptional repressor